MYEGGKKDGSVEEGEKRVERPSDKAGTHNGVFGEVGVGRRSEERAHVSWNMVWVKGYEWPSKGIQR